MLWGPGFTPVFFFFFFSDDLLLITNCTLHCCVGPLGSHHGVSRPLASTSSRRLCSACAAKYWSRGSFHR